MKRYFRSDYLVLAAVCAAYALCQAISARYLPLDYDEFFTFYIARLPGFGDVYSALLHGADNHPPLNYWVCHSFFALFGPSEFTLRLGSLLAAVLSLVCAYTLLRRRSGHSAALASLGVVILSRVSQVAHVGRSYALTFLWCSAGLLFWQSAASGRRRRASLAALAVLFFTASWLHYYTVLQLGAIAVAEFTRTVRLRKMDWPVWCAMGCGALGLPVVWPLLHAARAYTAHFWTPFNVQAVAEFYGDLFSYGIPAAFLALILWNAIPARRRAEEGTHAVPEIAAGVYLLLLPIVVFIAAFYTHALQSKYAIGTPLGASILVNLLAAGSSRVRLAIMGGFYGLALVLLPLQARAAARTPKIEPRLSAIYALARRTNVPIVIDNSHTFISASFYAPQPLAGGLFYLQNPIAAVALRGVDTDEYAMAGIAKVSPVRVVPEQEFLQHHDRFLLVHDSGWLLPDLLQRFNASARVVEVNGAGDVLEITTTLAPRLADQTPATH